MSADAPIGAGRKWAITFSVMMVTVMQVLDTSITNVALPHMQGSFSASIDEMSWVITSYLAANAVIIPASGWLTAVFGRRRFYLICTSPSSQARSCPASPRISSSSSSCGCCRASAAGR
jgi:MFS transporter, DHA2 family, multidrug resistance protein